MRLIDKDAVEKMLWRRLYKDKNAYNNCKNGLDKIQTAYDVDKVVERLEELNTYNLNLADAMCDIQKNEVGRTFVCLQDVIEIVKAGAKDDRITNN